jgi:hypothetical protein
VRVGEWIALLLDCLFLDRSCSVTLSGECALEWVLKASIINELLEFSIVETTLLLFLKLGFTCICGTDAFRVILGVGCGWRHTWFVVRVSRSGGESISLTLAKNRLVVY